MSSAAHPPEAQPSPAWAVDRDGAEGNEGDKGAVGAGDVAGYVGDVDTLPAGGEYTWAASC